MTKISLTQEQITSLEKFLRDHKPPELVSTYLFYVEEKSGIQPVLFAKEKAIYQSAEDAISILGKKGVLWHETEIKIGTDTRAVNEHTKKIYICPFSGKVFGDNTHPNPLDAIYDWVSRCPENTERIGGLRVKRFHVSEDPEMLQEYMKKTPAKQPVKKVVFSSVLSGKLFHSKEGLISDFKKNYLKRLSLLDVQNQNRFTIEEHFLKFIQEQIAEEKVTAFVEALAAYPQFMPYVEYWTEHEQDASEDIASKQSL